MGLIEDIKNMQQEGKTDSEISFALQNHGFPAKEIQDAMAQAKIKEAVAGTSSVSSEESKMAKTDYQNQDMKPSMMSSPEATAPPQEYSAINQDYVENQNPENSAPQEQYASQDAAQNYDQYAQQYSSYSPSGISSDMISEISEQIITEKLASIKNKLEETIDFKNITESKILYLDERLKRLEKIIDRLQLSVLQKVGDFMTNVEDIKKELIETQKSFKSLLPKVDNTAKANYKEM
ncbi:MAG: hypothetical protein AABX07_01560, partial [Nanoarchaeota archaeon]